MGTVHVSPQIPMHVSPKGIMIFKWIIVFHTHNSSKNQLQKYLIKEGH